VLLAGLAFATGPPPARASGGEGSGQPSPVRTLEALVDGFRAMPGFSARFEEEKTIALLERPLRASGRVYFVPPQRLVRRVVEPVPSLLELDADTLHYQDATGSDRFDLGASPTARVFAHTFTDVLAGDLPRLRATYDIRFEPEAEGEAGERAPWRLDLVPRDPTLGRAIEGLRVRGHGQVVLDLVVREASGDVTVTRFHDVDSRHAPAPPDAGLPSGPPAP
jgi:hypothetical protein